MMSRNKIHLQDSHKFSVVVNSDVNGSVVDARDWKNMKHIKLY